VIHFHTVQNCITLPLNILTRDSITAKYYSPCIWRLMSAIKCNSYHLYHRCSHLTNFISNPNNMRSYISIATISLLYDTILPGLGWLWPNLIELSIELFQRMLWPNIQQNKKLHLPSRVNSKRNTLPLGIALLEETLVHSLHMNRPSLFTFMWGRWEFAYLLQRRVQPSPCAWFQLWKNLVMEWTNCYLVYV